MNKIPVKPGPPIDESDGQVWGKFALVTYLPEPLGSFLTGMRQCVPSHDAPQAHITLLPPRHLPLPLEAASAEAHQILDGVEPFELELGGVRMFPSTSTLYLTITGGHQSLLRLHSALNSGGLYAPEHFEFIPHLTLGGPLAPGEITAKREWAERAWNDCNLSRSFVVNEIVFLWRSGALAGEAWTRVSSHALIPNPLITTGSPADAATQT